MAAAHIDDDGAPHRRVMSSVVSDSNPYSRLMALQRMGIVSNYTHIRNCTAAIVGVGGVGSVASEMLTRCGIGRLLLYDYDTVELANMNRLFYKPEHAGLFKTEAASRTLTEINPDVAIEQFNLNVTTTSGFEAFLDSLCEPRDVNDASSSIPRRSRVDLVLSCVDNYEARITVNQACLELNQTWFESGVSEDAVSGHIQKLVPGENACFECVPPLVVASGIDERTLKREGVCAASLPTTMGLVAAMLVQNALKYMLGFGEVASYVGYNALKDFFPTMAVGANLECRNSICRRRQQEYKAFMASPEQVAKLKAAEEAAAAAAAAEAAKPVHEENEWKIECVADDDDVDESAAAPNVSEGITFAMPQRESPKESGDANVAETDASVDDLVAQLKGLS